MHRTSLFSRDCLILNQIISTHIKNIFQTFLHIIEISDYIISNQTISTHMGFAPDCCNMIAVFHFLLSNTQPNYFYSHRIYFLDILNITLFIQKVKPYLKLSLLSSPYTPPKSTPAKSAYTSHGCLPGALPCIYRRYPS